MNGSPLAGGGREVRLVRRGVVVFRPSARIVVRAARRPPRIARGVVVRLDGRRISRRRPGRSSKIEWLVVGSAATVLLCFFVRMLFR